MGVEISGAVYDSYCPKMDRFDNLSPGSLEKRKVMLFCALKGITHVIDLVCSIKIAGTLENLFSGLVYLGEIIPDVILR
jgi:hypothetical protein